MKATFEFLRFFAQFASFHFVSRHVPVHKYPSGKREPIVDFLRLSDLLIEVESRQLVHDDGRQSQEPLLLSTSNARVRRHLGQRPVQRPRFTASAASAAASAASAAHLDVPRRSGGFETLVKIGEAFDLKRELAERLAVGEDLPFDRPVGFVLTVEQLHHGIFHRGSAVVGPQSISASAAIARRRSTQDEKILSTGGRRRRSRDAAKPGRRRRMTRSSGRRR